MPLIAPPRAAGPVHSFSSLWTRLARPEVTQKITHVLRNYKLNGGRILEEGVLAINAVYCGACDVGISRRIYGPHAPEERDLQERMRAGTSERVS